ncbi:MAG: substrate-binding domain-containing protein [Kribbellaceae bacterium]|nr:substrate-binding domain-containing protein [Kribbellaceae bacterium]
MPAGSPVAGRDPALSHRTSAGSALGALSLYEEDRYPGTDTVENARRSGVSVPDDLSVVGVDNQSIIADALSLGLTTLALPYYEMGAPAVASLIARLDSDQPMLQLARAFPSKIVERQSMRVLRRDTPAL